MLAPSGVIKQTAKTALSGKMLIAFAASCVFIFMCIICTVLSELIWMVAGAVAGVLAIAALVMLLCAPLFFGVLYYFRRLLWGQNDNITIIFRYFSSVDEYKRALHLTLLLATRLVSAGIVLFLPSIILSVLASDEFYSLIGISLPVWSSNLWVVVSFLRLVAGVLLFFVMLKYYMAPFLFVSDDGMDAAEAVNMSAIISKRTISDFFWLMLSMAGWIALSLLLMPLPFLLPYFMCVYGVHCRFAVTDYNKDVDRFNSEYIPHFEADI